MDIKAYIESGILESYVMRLTSPEETAEVESMMATYPEIADAVTDFEMRLEDHLLDNAVTPPAFIREQLINQLAPEFSGTDETDTGSANQPAKIVTLPTSTPVWKYVAAAAIVLLLGSGWLNFHYYGKYAKIENDYKALLANQGSLMANIDANQSRMNGMENIMKVMMDPAIKRVALLPPDKNNTLLATAFWNATTKELYLAQNKLPVAPAGKQYQLWALVKGQPVNAGIIDDCGQLLCKMVNITEADAFAITLEKSGGSPTPDLSQLKVIGNI